MYSFKYHLVTICSVFLALAIGLVLGAAVAGSGVLSTTTSNLVDSLFAQYSDLSEENSQLELKAEQYQEFSGTFVQTWDDNKLVDRNVLIITGVDGDGDQAASTVAQYVKDAGGNYATVHVNVEQFGTLSDSVLEPLQQILPAQDQYSYSDVLGYAIAGELSRGVQTSKTFDGGSITQSTEFSQTDLTNYPLTCYLVSNGVIWIENSSNIPDTFNACIDMYVTDTVQQESTTDSEGNQVEKTVVTYEADPVGSAIARAFQNAQLPVVFTQSATVSSVFVEDASLSNAAVVTSYEGYLGRYSIVWLLAYGGSGVYGPDQDSPNWFPA